MVTNETLREFYVVVLQRLATVLREAEGKLDLVKDEHARDELRRMELALEFLSRAVGIACAPDTSEGEVAVSTRILREHPVRVRS